jgi:D-serine dehydratase
LEACEGAYVEPSAAAGLRGPAWLLGSAAGAEYLQRHHLASCMGDATHVIWSTGGSLVPEAIRQGLRARGQASVERGDETGS